MKYFFLIFAFFIFRSNLLVVFIAKRLLLWNKLWTIISREFMRGKNLINVICVPWLSHCLMNLIDIFSILIRMRKNHMMKVSWKKEKSWNINVKRVSSVLPLNIFYKSILRPCIQIIQIKAQVCILIIKKKPFL